MSNIIPCRDKILIQRLSQENKTQGGILIPDTAKEKPMMGTVIAVGPGIKNEKGEYQKIDIAKGDVVIFTKYSGTELKDGDQEYLILSEADIIAKKI